MTCVQSPGLTERGEERTDISKWSSGLHTHACPDAHTIHMRTHTHNSIKRCRRFKQKLIYQGEAKQRFQKETGVSFCFVEYKEDFMNIHDVGSIFMEEGDPDHNRSDLHFRIISSHESLENPTREAGINTTRQ